MIRSRNQALHGNDEMANVAVSTSSKGHVVAVKVGESVLSIRKGNPVARAALGAKFISALRRREPKPGVGKSSDGLRAIRETR